MTDDTDSVSRRNVLAGLGALGVGGALAGAGTSAFFSDREDFEGNQLVAGELDLKVDWQEHYYDATSGAEYVEYGEPDDTTSYVGLPNPNDPLVWVDEGDLGTFMDDTALEAYPDPDNDWLQEPFADEPGGETGGVGYICADGADTTADLDPTGGGEGTGLRTKNDDTWDGDDWKPLINLDDVKPGDFGEATLSFHLCDNPGYVWLQGGLDKAAENGVTDPEENDTDESGPEYEDSDSDDLEESQVELLDEIQTVLWYDVDGDNVFDDTEILIAEGSLRDLLGENGLGMNDGLGIPLSPAGFTVDQFQDDIACATDKIACEALGKVEYDDKSGEFSDDSGNVTNITQPYFTEDPVQATLEFEIEVDGDMKTVTILLDNIAIKDEPGKYEIIEFDVVVEGPVDIGIGCLDVKGGGGPVPKKYEFDECKTTIGDVSPPEITGGSGQTQQTGLSYIEFYYCRPKDDTGDERRARCFPASEDWYIGFAWYLPVNHANEIQTDKASFDLGFYTEQCRHNDGSGMVTGGLGSK